MVTEETSKITIADLVGALSQCVEAQRQLGLCRKRATGNVEYYSYGYIQDLNVAEKHLETTLNAYIDQRVAERLERPNPIVAASRAAAAGSGR
jgi:hypothetical protein